MSIFTSFSATAGDKTVSLNWTYVAQEVGVFDFNEITQLSVYVTDKFIYESNSGDVSTTSRKLEPLAVPGSPTITYDVTDLINGREYIFCVEAILNYSTVYNSVIATATPVALTSGIPPKPNFLLDQISPNKFRVRLYTTDTSNNIPKASVRSGLNGVNLVTYSAFDNGLPLKAIYIVYSDATRIKTDRFTIAPDVNNAYTTEFEVEVRAKNWNEVNVKVENNNGISELSNSKAIYVDIIPSVPRTCQVIENITLGSGPANKLTWVVPVYVGAPALDYYQIQRKVSTDANFSSTIFKQVSGSDLSYNDTDISVNVVYNYRIRATNLDDVSNYPNNIRNYSDYVLFVPSSITGVVFPTINSVSKTPSNGKFTVTIDANSGGFPQNKITYDISVNDISKNVTGSSSNVIDISGNNGTKYYFQTRVVAQSVVDGTRYYRSNWSEVQMSMPYPSLNNPSSVVVTPLNNTNQPLDSSIYVSWTDPSIETYIDPSFSINISYKVTGTDDSTYQVVTVSGTSNTTIQNLTNGTPYDFKIQTRQFSEEANDYIYSSGVTSNSVIPFTYPVDVSNVIFTTDEYSTLSYSFDQLTGIEQTGGLDVMYEVKLYNISNGGSDLLDTQNTTSTNGTYGGEYGRQYKLTVRAYVIYSIYTFYSSEDGVEATLYTPAQPPAAPSVTNIDGNNVPLDGQIDLTWTLPDGYDDNNVTYNIYRYNIFNDETLLNETPQSEEFYSDTGVTNGSDYTYKVELLLNNVSAGKSQASVTIMPFTYANKLASSDVFDQVISITTVDISFNQASFGTSGLNPLKTILNTDQTIYADGAAGTAVEGSPYGWGFNNFDSNAGRKINWYYYAKQRDSRSIQVKDLTNMYCVVNESEINVENPFFIVYTVPNGSGWYGSKLFYGSNALPANVDKTKPILLYTGNDNLAIHPEIAASNRQQLQLNPSLSVPSSVNDASVLTNTEEINLISLQTSSQAVSYNHYDFVCHEMGYVSGGVINQSKCITATEARTTNLFYKFVWDHIDNYGNSYEDSYGQVVDFSDNYPNNLFTISTLTHGYKYSLKIYTGVKPGGFNGETIFYSDTDYLTVYICSYDIDSVDIANINPEDPISLTLRPGNTSYLADWPDNIFEIDGLTIYGYRLYSTADTNAFYEVTNSTFAEEGLTNGTTYTVYLACIYKDAAGRSVYTGYISGQVTPTEGPNSPQNVEVYSITNGEVLVSWDVDYNNYPDASGSNTANITHYSIFIDGTVYREHVPITDAAFTRETSVNESYDRYQIVIPLAQNNKKYIISIIAEVDMTYTINAGTPEEVTTVMYSVSSPTKINANCYTTRSGPAKNISYVPIDSEFSVSWQAPDNSGNSGVSGNGVMQYYVKLYKADSNNDYSLFVDYTSIISSRSATFYNIENGINYKIQVYAVYLVSGSDTYARSEVAELSPLQSGVAPLGIDSFTAIPTNTGSDGKQVELQFNFNSADEVIFNDNSKFTFSIQRQIYDCSSNVLLSNISYDLSSPNLTGFNSGNSGTVGQTVIDLGSDASSVFLNGNIITYTLTVTYVNWLSNYSQVFTSTVSNVIPYGKPLFLAIPDISGNAVTVYFSKNGRPMNAIILVGIDPNNNSIPIKSYTSQQLAALNYRNASSSTIASNQSVQLVAQMTVGNQPVNIESVLAILANPGATVLESYPNEAGSDFNKTDPPPIP